MKEFYSAGQSSFDAAYLNATVARMALTEKVKAQCAIGTDNKDCTPQELYMRGEWKRLIKEQLTADHEAGF